MTFLEDLNSISRSHMFPTPQLCKQSTPLKIIKKNKFLFFNGQSLILIFIKMQRREDIVLHTFVNSWHIVSDTVSENFSKG